jgi:C1A family cysteine protease
VIGLQVREEEDKNLFAITRYK